ncbi:MAG TPA: DMT family transporter [Acidimicrobiales bacterium]|nr:DMT family transporter [Acidimicrobiales bacterium]|tara:strand:+ start:2475 stop:3302 length:828 start_codon:yes stop_codon:yes gene_type:complete
MSAIYGVIAALGVGVGDHVTRGSADRSFISQALGVFFFGNFICALLAVWWFGGEWRSGDLIVGALSGLIAVSAIGTLYLGYQAASAGVVGPPAAVLAVVVPVGFDLTFGQIPSNQILVGIVIGIVSVLLISFNPLFAGNLRRGIGFSVIAGLSYGFLFVTLDQISAESGFWSAVSQRMVGFLIFAGFSLRQGRKVFPTKNAVWISSLGALFASVGALAFLYGLQHGDLAPVAAVGTQYAAVTVICGYFFRKENLRSWQWIGLAGTVASLSLIVTG